MQRVERRRVSLNSLRNSIRTHNIGLEARAPKWTIRPLTEQEKNELLQGPADLRAKQNADWEFILANDQDNCRILVCARYATRL